MKHIFEPVRLGRLTLKNRLVRSATMETYAVADGKATPALKQTYEALARGGVGLIITGMMGVGPNCRVSPEMIGTELEGFSHDLRELAEAVHACGSKLVVQLSHCGFKATQLSTVDAPRSPSPTELPSGGTSLEMTPDEIRRVTADFAAAARRCQAAGADGVQIHSAHAYLLSQFLSPHFNRRTDAYGGSIENRARIVFEVYDAVRQAVGEDYPVLIKINYSDLLPDGLTGEESEFVCRKLEERGVDAIEVSSGVNVDRASASSPRIVDGQLQSFAAAGMRIASLLHTPVISVGGHRDPVKITQLLNESGIAAVSMSRPFLREPDLPAKWERDSTVPADCISCNKCFRGLYFCRQIEAQQ